VRHFNPVALAMRKAMQKVVTIGSLLVLCLALAHCAPVVQNPTPHNDQAVQASLHSEKEYQLQIGDQLDIKFFYNSELNEQVTVRPDGRISLQLVHEIVVAGLTPTQLKERLIKKYAEEIPQPEIAVIVRSINSQRVYVDGEVTKSGMVPLVGITTVLQALSQAGGVKDSARTSEVIVIRRGADNKPLVIPVNLKIAIDGTDMSQDIILSPFDIVYVPKSPVANMNKWVDQYIRKNLPISITSGFGYYP
jgi:polysaccharide export outer membrane protein